MQESETAQRIVSGLAKIGLLLRHHAWRRASARGLTPTQSQLLAVLQSSTASSCRLSALAHALAITPATASDAVAALLEKGMVRKEEDAQDARAVALTLTRKGRREAVLGSTWPDYLLTAVDALAPAEQGAFLLSLIKMVRSLQDQGRIPLAHMCVNCTYFFAHRYAEPERPHHCGFVNAPFGSRQLRLDCSDFEPALVSIQNANLHALSSHS